MLWAGWFFPEVPILKLYSFHSMQDKSLSLSELTSQVKSVLSSEMGGFYWVVAEIAELKVNGMSGHCYLELIEKDDSNKTLARVRATIWAAQYRMIRPYFESTTGQFLDQGIKVLLRVTLEFHEVYGISLNVRDIDPSYTMGDLSRRRMEILQQLEADGVLQMNRELDFPVLPKRIAVISSGNAAGYEDFVEQLQNNEGNYHFSVKLFDAVMQGDGAAGSVMNALDQVYLEADAFDCVVIVRGGGAALDLTCFDDYDLAYLITQFPLPVLSGIGHQKDDTITDMVAFLKLKTPTAVAAFLIDCMVEAETHLNMLAQDISGNARSFLDEEKRRIDLIRLTLPGMVQGIVRDYDVRLNRIAEKLPFAAGDFLADKEHQLQRYTDKLLGSSTLKLTAKENQLKGLCRELKTESWHLLEKKINQLNSFAMKAELLDPGKLLKRGYSITTHHGKVVKSAGSLSPGDIIETHLHKGKVESEVKK